MHTDFTLDIMGTATSTLGNMLRDFKETTCSSFATKELRREYDVRIRREGKKGAPKAGQQPAMPLTAGQATPATITPNVEARSQTKPASRRRKTLNLNTYKGHSLGDVMDAIREYGTTDSFSTEPVCASFLYAPPYLILLPSLGGVRTSVAQGQVYPDKP